MKLLSHIISILLVITVIFGTVAFSNVQQAFAYDSVKIQNSVKSTTNTGGQTDSGGQSGQNGTDGTDGTPGKSGSNGVDGVDGSNAAVSSDDNSARAYVKSTIGTESVTQKSVALDGPTAQATITTEYTKKVSSISGDTENEGADHTQTGQSNFIKKLQSLYLILLNYVSLLF